MVDGAWYLNIPSHTKGRKHKKKTEAVDKKTRSNSTARVRGAREVRALAPREFEEHSDELFAIASVLAHN
jgi:hypothetical protein